MDATGAVKNFIAKSMHCQFNPVSDPYLLKLVSNNGALFLQATLIRIVAADSLAPQRPCTQAEADAGYPGYIASHTVSQLSAATQNNKPPGMLEDFRFSRGGPYPKKPSWIGFCRI